MDPGPNVINPVSCKFIPINKLLTYRNMAITFLVITEECMRQSHHRMFP